MTTTNPFAAFLRGSSAPLAILLLTTNFATAEQRLTNDGRLKRDPVVLDGGRQIVYSAQHEAPRLVLRRLNLSDGGDARLHPKSLLPEFGPRYSSDGKAVSYMRMVGNDVLEMRVEFPMERRTVKVAAAKKTIWHGAIAPDGKWLVYSASGQIYAQDIAGGKRWRLTETAGRNNHPTISPDGKEIAFSSSRDGDYEIYRMRRDGSSVRRLTKSRGLDIRPNWSPDGKWLAFTSARDGDYEIYAVKSNGGAAQRITTNPERDDYASWHPDGKRLCVVSEREGATDLYLIPFEAK